MKQESSVLKRNLHVLQNAIPPEMGEKLSGYLLAIAKESLDVMKDHKELREKHNMGVLMTHEKEEIVKDNLMKAFTMIKQENAFYQFLHLRRTDQPMVIQDNQIN